ncbi:MAG: hypothetical protein ACYCQL_01400 [Acidithiobacillus sp.]
MEAHVRCGACFFDDPATHDSGWALPSLKEDIFRFGNTADLSSDVAWWTNLSYEAVSISGLQGARFRRESYFSHPMRRFWNELGIDESDKEGLRANPRSVWDGRFDNGDFLRLGVSTWLFEQILAIMDDFLPMAAPPLNDLAYGLRERILPDVRRFFPDGPPPDYFLSALEAADNAYQPTAINSYDRARAGKGDGLLPGHFRVPVDRVAHAQQLFRVPFPIGGWRNVGDMSILSRRGPERVLDWLDQNPGSMVRATMKRCDPRMESMINYGANIQKNARSGHWLTSLELAALMPWCEFILHEGVVGERLCSIREILEGAMPRLAAPKSGFGSAAVYAPGYCPALDSETVRMRSVSYPYQIFMDVLWRAAIGTIPKAPRSVRNPASAFVRAADRMLLFEVAAQLHSASIGVSGYGSGGVLISPPEGMAIQEWVPILLAQGLLPPFLPHGLLSEEWVMNEVENAYNPDRTSENVQMLQMAFLLGGLDMVVRFSDEFSLYHPDVGDGAA